MVDKVLFDINRLLAWLAFGEEAEEDGRVVNPSKDRPGYYQASRLLPAYTSSDDAAQILIDHYQRRGAVIRFSELNDGWQCEFTPAKEDTSWNTSTATAKTRPLSVCLAILRSAGRVAEFHGRITVNVRAMIQGDFEP